MPRPAPAVAVPRPDAAVQIPATVPAVELPRLVPATAVPRPMHALAGPRQTTWSKFGTFLGRLKRLRLRKRAIIDVTRAERLQPLSWQGR
ncbi:hypothetical protein IE81DRAFT_325606 [Ceraceosorus guamensis]|uniref:Uncharacterized protein n=1 Tax=Ceraceosorus guamensis TaxID=1522189 RepID=A0A316VTK7_9BASI|nr:hypothetical protein IE81DRAFT_325606 [Ceraceosorus guamensis]PWN40378.1 hypothetical protein IE81DRAFT_325606 [Ceraceosorus guamensis]